MNQSAITSNFLKARQKSHEQDWSSLACYSFKNWCEIFKPFTKCGNRNRVIIFDRTFRRSFKTCLLTHLCVCVIIVGWKFMDCVGLANSLLNNDYFFILFRCVCFCFFFFQYSKGIHLQLRIVMISLLIELACLKFPWSLGPQGNKEKQKQKTNKQKKAMKKPPFCVDWLPPKPVLICFPIILFVLPYCFLFEKANRKEEYIKYYYCIIIITFKIIIIVIMNINNKWRYMTYLSYCDDGNSLKPQWLLSHLPNTIIIYKELSGFRNRETNPSKWNRRYQTKKKRFTTKCLKEILSNACYNKEIVMSHT